jgi:hypothetical protein
VLEEIPGASPAWDGAFSFPPGVGEEIRVGNWYRLDVAAGPSMMILVAKQRVDRGSGVSSVLFESIGNPLSQSSSLTLA